MNILRKKLFVLTLLLATVGGIQAKNALVVIAHGSPMPSWRKPVLDMENIVRQKLASHPVKGIDYMRVALMEYTEPSVATVVKDCVAQGADTIFALPLFIAPSSHTEEDLPNIFGMKYNKYVRADLAEEKTELLHTNIPIVLGPTFYYSYVLEKAMMQRIKEMSKDEANEAVIFLAHGDPERIGFWNMMLGHVQKYTKANSKITYTDAKQIEMGHDFSNELLPMLQKAAKSKKRILVQGIYLTSDVKRMADRHQMTEKQTKLTKKGVEIVYSDKGILPASSDLIADWIIEEASDWIKNKQ